MRLFNVVRSILVSVDFSVSMASENTQAVCDAQNASCQTQQNIWKALRTLKREHDALMPKTHASRTHRRPNGLRIGYNL